MTKKKRDALKEAAPAWPYGTLLRPAPTHGAEQIGVYVWNNSLQDFLLAGFVGQSEYLIYVAAWCARGLRYAECTTESGAPVIVLEADVKQTEGGYGA